LTVVTHTTYRMAPVASLPGEISDAFMANRITAVLHYSRRSARAFLDAIRAGGLEISALALPQCCISAAVAAVLHDAGATQVVVAAQPDENALLDALVRALRPPAA
jgi:uroporphyrinogen-III synthase